MGRRLRNHGSGERATAYVPRKELDAERAVSPTELESIVVVEFVPPPAAPTADEIGERFVILRRPWLGREKALQKLLHRRQGGEVDAPERVTRQVHRRRRCESATGDFT